MEGASGHGMSGCHESWVVPKNTHCGVGSMLFRLQEEGGVLREMFRKYPGRTLRPNIPTSRKNREKWGTQFLPPPRFSQLFADAEFSNDSFVALGIVSLEVVEQATPLADQHKQAAARAVVLLVRLEVVRQLANAFTDDGDLNLGTPRVSRVRLIPVNDGFLLLSG